MKSFSILWIGDVFGSVGRKTLVEHLQNPAFNCFDFVIVNVENATHGKAISEKHARHLSTQGVHVMTYGNHVPDFVEPAEFRQKNTLIPANLDPFPAGWSGTKVWTIAGLKIQVTSLLGQTFIRNQTTNPFHKLKEIVAASTADLHFVDFHAETTAEKKALAWAFDGQITGLAGTHTHVQTSDARLLPNGSFFMTDLGMTGPFNSVIGAEPKGVIAKNFGEKGSIRPASGAAQFCGVKIEVNPVTKKVAQFFPFFLRFD